MVKFTTTNTPLQQVIEIAIFIEQFLFIYIYVAHIVNTPIYLAAYKQISICHFLLTSCNVSALRPLAALAITMPHMQLCAVCI